LAITPISLCHHTTVIAGSPGLLCINRRQGLQYHVLRNCVSRHRDWCFGPEGELPIGDVMLAQKIALENNEQAALGVANRGNPHQITPRFG
jgi:hypothetical protein